MRPFGIVLAAIAALGVQPAAAQSDDVGRLVAAVLGDTPMTSDLETLADRFGVSERTIQRALQRTLGRGPKWVSRRIRLQEVARLLASNPTADLAALAVALGYTDQAHLINDFRGVAGTTPGAYVRELGR